MDNNLRPGEKYYPVDSCPMKCRIYPNKTQQEKIGDYLHGVQAFYNMVLHDIMVNNRFTKESKDKKTGEVIHFVDWGKITKKETLDEYRLKNRFIGLAPATALSSNVSGCINDMKKGAKSDKDSKKEKPVERFKYLKRNKKGELVEHQSPAFYSKNDPRTSYTVTEQLRKLKPSDNDNVFYFNFAKLGLIKVRGWNKNNRYLVDGEYVDFVKFAQARKDTNVIVTISVDNCGDYWASFTVCCNDKSKYDTRTYKRMTEINTERIGVDVGQETLATLSNGHKYMNPKFAESEKQKTSTYSKQLSNSWGYSNPDFREARKNDRSLQPSNNSEKIKIRNAKHNRDIVRKREYNQNLVSRDIVKQFSYIAVESLNVSDLMDKEKNFKKYETRQKAANHSRGLSDAAMSKFLTMLKNKSKWYGRQIATLGEYERSTGVCPCCGYVTPEKMDTNIREWDCPNCGEHHDRDIAAAKVILQKSSIKK